MLINSDLTNHIAIPDPVIMEQNHQYNVYRRLSLKQGTGNGGTGNEERGTGNGESLKGGISKRENL